MDDYPVQSPGQLASHLRALRKVRGLSQAQLGALLGVGQTRVARIERDPSAVSVAQFLNVLNALAVQMVLRPPVATPVTQGPGARKATAKTAVKAYTPSTAKRRPAGDW